MSGVVVVCCFVLFPFFFAVLCCTCCADFVVLLFVVFSFVAADEPGYWWFELMILLNKTMMCGGLVVLSPGSPSQVVCAILFMMFHMLLVLKLAPYINDSEDWSSFSSSLGLTLTYVGALVQMLQSQRRKEFDPEELRYASIAMDALPVMCVSIVVVIITFADCGLWNFLRKKNGGVNKTGAKSNTSLTQVKPINQDEEGNNGNNEPLDAGEAQGLRVWGQH